MNPPAPARALPHAVALGAAAAAAGAIILLRWWLNVDLFNSVLGGKLLMMPWTAAGFMLLGLSLWIQARAYRRLDGPSRAEQWLAITFAVLVLAIGLITQVEFLTGWNPGFDLLLFKEAVLRTSTIDPGRVSPVASVVQPLLALSLILTAWPLRSAITAAPALLAVVAGLTGLSGQLYDADTLFSVAGYPTVSLLVASLFVVVGVGALMLQPDQPVLAPFMNRHGGGAMGRRLLPAVVALPMVLGWVRLELQMAGWYGSRVGFALYTCSNIVVFAILIWWIARVLNRVDEEREAVGHRARAVLAESEQRYRALAESLPQLVWTCCPDGWCDYVSPQWVSYTGVPADQQLGSGWSRQVHPDDLGSLAAQWDWSVKSGEPLDFEYRIRRHDGVYRWFRTMASPVRDAAGRIDKWFGSNTDIDDRKRAEADLQELTSALERRVEERTAELRAAKEHAESADRLKTDFIMTMSHELRTPLNAIIGFTGTLLTKMPGPLTSEQDKQLRIVQTSGRHLLMLINDVLDVAKIEAGSFSYNPQPIDAAQIMRAVGAELTPLAREKGLALECLSNAPSVPLTTDVRAIRQVLINLISNAIKFTERGAIVLTANLIEDGDSARIELSVSDSGIGIDPADLPKLFVKFGRLHDARSARSGGTGLGLYLCKLITSQLGAGLTVHSDPRRGSVFTVSFHQHTRQPANA
jgi:PAS domain S-box-containing protein